ncbi:hypothetical protein Rsub_07015 [Raphidocelis subcapitata]|uniref:DEK-C domain-containing protein n=1 Tax=Raphidocelis subcapitata TaxID=307507 RepID=A0A2V0P3N2_9CHLO|nr:hypothetical protein Rsub_07015 [Raphidocelis subcapitata]|eukprot:GBF94481.1 hypothetical protein Rsub_07015 [Raphidocelis subcapitata]
MATAAQVRAALRRLLPKVNLESTTERMIRDLAAKELGGANLDAHKALIRDEINAYLTATAAAELEASATAATTAAATTSGRGDSEYVPTATERAAAEASDEDDDDDDDDSDFESDEEDDLTDGGRGRGRGGGAKRKRAPAGAAAKRARGGGGGGAAAAAAGPPGGASWRLGAGRKFARVENWKGSWRVDLREFYEARLGGVWGGERHKDGALLPGSKGIALSPHEWGLLAAALPAVGAALEGRDEGYSLQLSDTRRVTVGGFRGTMLAQVREYYQAQAGDWLPGKKGVALAPDALKDLARASDDITAALPAGAAAAPAAAAAAAPAAAPAGASGQGQQRGPAPAQGQAGPAAAAAGGGGGGAAASDGGEDFVDLGRGKRARINVYKNTKYVDLREFYQKDSAWLPGKKGISLVEADWQAVKGAMAAAAAAAEAKDLAFSVQLSGKRKLAVSEFKGTVYIGVREFYEKDGKELPGSKGLSMTTEQWGRLVAGAPALDALLAKA